ncbi:hypothetical protein V8F20_000382 [Naviculisporaceae sp. PSN 640]
MGADMSTLKAIGGWGFVLFFGAVYFDFVDLRAWFKKREAITTEQQNRAARDLKEKNAKKERAEAFKKAKKESEKAPKPAPSVPAQASSSKNDDEVNDRAFAQQLTSVKQGTNLNAPKKNEEKRQKSVKQSRIRAMEEKAEEPKVSAPSSNAGGDADVSESPFASPEVKAADATGVADMLEPQAPGPSVLRLTDTDKVKQKTKKAKAPEKVETKKQRQNRQKAEAEKALRAESEKERQVKLEAQRRLARISEGRPAKDGSAFMQSASQPEKSVWTSTSNGINGSSSSSSVNGDFVPVQPLDTFEMNGRQEAPAPKNPAPKVDNWKTPSLSEEEQMELLRDEEAWSTVKTKKPRAKKVEPEAVESANEAEPAPAPTSAPQPVAAPKTVKAGGAKPSVKFTQQSSFAALSSNDKTEEVETEWDV